MKRNLKYFKCMKKNDFFFDLNFLMVGAVLAMLLTSEAEWCHITRVTYEQ